MRQHLPWGEDLVWSWQLLQVCGCEAFMKSTCLAFVQVQKTFSRPHGS